MLAEHQADAVERALAIIGAFGGVILADEPGLGKSFIAAEIARRMHCEVDLIVPASLVAQWREFDLDAAILALLDVDERDRVLRVESVTTMLTEPARRLDEATGGAVTRAAAAAARFHGKKNETLALIGPPELPLSRIGMPSCVSQT